MVLSRRSWVRVLAVVTLLGGMLATPAGAWRRHFRGSDADGSARGRTVALDGAGDVIAGGFVVNLGSGSAFTVVKLDGGTVAGNVAARQMRRDGGTERIGYQLRMDGPNGALWGDGTSGTGYVSGTGNGAAQSLTVHGRVPAQASTMTGHYEDTVTATVEY